MARVAILYAPGVGYVLGSGSDAEDLGRFVRDRAADRDGFADETVVRLPRRLSRVIRDDARGQRGELRDVALVLAADRRLGPGRWPPRCADCGQCHRPATGCR